MHHVYVLFLAVLGIRDICIGAEPDPRICTSD